MKSEIYQHWQLPADPWDRHQHTADSTRIGTAVSATIRAGGLAEIVGPRGAGKTHAVWRALLESGQTVICPERLDRERLHIGDIQRAIIGALTDERPRHSAEDRAGQIRRLLMQNRGQAVLLIDDAHLLHHQTLRALKRLRELGAQGSRRALIAIVLVGQKPVTSQASEVALRTQTMTLAGLTRKEREAALVATIGSVAGDGAIEQLATSEGAGNWLQLERLVDDALALGMSRGDKRITAATLAGGDNCTAEAPAPGAVASKLAGRRARRAA